MNLNLAFCCDSFERTVAEWRSTLLAATIFILALGASIFKTTHAWRINFLNKYSQCALNMLANNRFFVCMQFALFVCFYYGNNDCFGDVNSVYISRYLHKFSAQMWRRPRSLSSIGLANEQRRLSSMNGKDFGDDRRSFAMIGTHFLELLRAAARDDKAHALNPPDYLMSV